MEPAGIAFYEKTIPARLRLWKCVKIYERDWWNIWPKAALINTVPSLSLVWFYCITTVWCVIKLKSFRWVMVINPIRLRGCWNVVRWRLSHDDFVDLRILFLSERQADVCQTQVCRTPTGRMYTTLPRSGLLSDSLWLRYEIIHCQLQITVHKWKWWQTRCWLTTETVQWEVLCCATTYDKCCHCLTAQRSAHRIIAKIKIQIQMYLVFHVSIQSKSLISGRNTCHR